MLFPFQVGLNESLFTQLAVWNLLIDFYYFAKKRSLDIDCRFQLLNIFDKSHTHVVLAGIISRVLV